MAPEERGKTPGNTFMKAGLYRQIIESTGRIPDDKDWWKIRAIILARDLNREVGPKDLRKRIELRRN